MPARPSPPRFVAYALGFRLPDRFDDWVFHDLNDRGWWLREVMRIEFLALPFVIGVLFVPGEISLRLGLAAILFVGPSMVALCYADEFRASRLRQHGLLPPQGPDPD